MTPEFSRKVRIDTLGSAAREMSIEADEGELAALAARFDLIGVDSLSATFGLTRAGDTVTASATLRAAVVQACVATGEPVPAQVDERFTILFRPPPETRPDEEVELGEEELDVVFYEGGLIDLGEAAAETLSLSLDPYPRCAEAEVELRKAGVRAEAEAEAERAAAAAARNPFAALRKSES